MSNLARAFATCRERHEGALVIFVTAGDPQLADFADLLLAIDDGGADIIEVGIPFSDPLMDGPVIQASAERALAAGTTPHGTMEVIAEVRPRLSAALAYMTPYNIVWRFGLPQFAKECHQAGIDGVLITDLPPEEAATWKQTASRQGVDTIFLAAPTSSDERLGMVGHSTGFVYLISRRGVTGTQADVPDELGGLTQRLRALTTAPIAVGFGISTPQHVAQVCAVADGAVVGSALVAALDNAESPAQRRQIARDMTSLLKSGTRMR